MTIIVGAITRKDGVVLAADSQTTSGGLKLDGDGGRSKLWVDKEHGYIFGSCGMIRQIQVVQYHVEWPKWRPDEHELVRFGVTEIVPAIRAGVEGHGVLKEKSGVETLDACTIIGLDNENLLEVESDFCVMPSVNGRIADGSGYAEAYGSLGEKGPWTKDDVIEAARRATLTANGVGGDIYWVSTKDLKIRKA